METTQSYPNLLSEKQAAKRLGIARITLLRAREAGRIRFFRIGTRVLYCAEHLTEFLNNCERDRRRTHANERERVSAAPRKENVSSGRTRGNSTPARKDRFAEERTSVAIFCRSRLMMTATTQRYIIDLKLRG